MSSLIVSENNITFSSMALFKTVAFNSPILRKNHGEKQINFVVSDQISWKKIPPDRKVKYKYEPS